MQCASLRLRRLCPVIVGRCPGVLWPTVSAQFFKMTLGIWSGPHVLRGLIDVSNLHTSAVVMLISLITGCCGGTRCGEQKSLCKRSSIISAFSSLSHTSEPFFFQGATPMLSCFLLFMYFHQGFELFVWSPWVVVLLLYSHSALRILFLHVFWMACSLSSCVFPYVS